MRRGDIVHNSFSYHLTPGGFIMESGAHALGCAVIPAGTGNTEQQLDAIAHLKPSGYLGTPDFLKVLLDTAAKTGKDASSLRRGLVSGAALPASLREELTARGVAVLQCYATAELGVIAYESEAPRRHDRERDACWSRSCGPAPAIRSVAGEVGEVVVTSFNPDYPMIRLATGDLSAVMAGALALRAHQHAHRRLDGPRRPDHQGQGHVRASRRRSPRSASAIPSLAGCGSRLRAPASRT